MSDAMASIDHENGSSDRWWSSWDASHVKTCQSRGALFASATQVQEFTEASLANDMDGSKILWSLPREPEVIRWKYDMTVSWKGDQNGNEMMESLLANHLQQLTVNENATKATPASAVPMTTDDNNHHKEQQDGGGSYFQYVTSAFSPIVGMFSPGRPARPTTNSMYEDDEEDDALKDWSEFAAALDEEDDALQYNSNKEDSKSGGLIAWDAPVLNVELTKQCVEILLQVLSQEQQDGGISVDTFPTMVTRRRRNHKGKCWMDWIHEAAQASNGNSHSKSLLSRLSEVEVDFLLACLSKMGKVTLIFPSLEDPNQPPLEELVAFMPVESASAAEGNNSTETYHQFLLSWWKFSQALEFLETQRHEWALQADKWARKAVQERNNAASSGMKNAGLVSLKLHKQFQKKLDDSENTLLNLEQARHAMETSWHQRQVVEALQVSTQTLQHMQSQTGSIQQVDDILETYREEMEQVGFMQQSLANDDQQNSAVEALMEEDLLAELAGLSLQDADDPGNPSSARLDNDATAPTEVFEEPTRFSVDPPATSLIARASSSPGSSKENAPMVENHDSSGIVTSEKTQKVLVAE